MFYGVCNFTAVERNRKEALKILHTQNNDH